MTRTTDEWQQLLDGTTEGPWEWIDEPGDADAQYIIDWNTGNMCLSVDAIGSGSSYRPSDPLLAAAAPEAVAEVVRLREELEALRRACIESAEEAERKAEVAYIPDPYVAVAETERDTADIITRILDGSES